MPRARQRKAVAKQEEKVEASQGSVIGLRQQLGTTGFRHLKIALAQVLVQPIQFVHEDLNRVVDTATVIEKIFHSDIQAPEDTLSVLDPMAIAKAAKLVRSAKRVKVFGIDSAAPGGQRS